MSYFGVRECHFSIVHISVRYECCYEKVFLTLCFNYPLQTAGFVA